MEGKGSPFRGRRLSALRRGIDRVFERRANAMHDNFTPLGGAVLLTNMMLDEVIIGGVGCRPLRHPVVLHRRGLCGGADDRADARIHRQEDRTRGNQDDDVGDHYRARLVMLLAAVASVVPSGWPAWAMGGPHGFSEILYAYTSAANTNGSAFAGLNANTPFYNLTLSLAMFGGGSYRHRAGAGGRGLACREAGGAALGREPADRRQLVCRGAAAISLSAGSTCSSPR